MSDSSIINNAARILKLVQAGTPADQALRESLTQNRHYTAPAERRNISRLVFTYYRWWRWLDENDSPQKQLAASLALQERFDKNPASFKPEAFAARAVPDWLKDEMDALPSAWLIQLQRQPALWIRTKRNLEEKVVTALGNCTAAVLPPTLSSQLSAFRYTGITDLYRTQAFQNGEFEIQDLASQLVGFVAAPKPGETWWDACAGEGGKMLHLSDLMENKGLIWASDRSTRRLAKLKERAARAKVFNFRVAPWEGTTKLPTKTKFDGILIDAPCTGIGTWQRNPHARWTTQPQDIRELSVIQKQLLNNAANSLKPGGRLIYAVCTLTRAETTGVAGDFTTGHPEFESCSIFSEFHLKQDDAEHRGVFLWPQDLNANGMFIAVWKKR